MEFGEMGQEGLTCINLSQNRKKWQAVVHTAMNFRAE